MDTFYHRALKASILNMLTHLSLDKIATKLQTKALSAISSMKIGQFWYFLTEIYCLMCGWWEATIGFDNGFVPTMRQVII